MSSGFGAALVVELPCGRDFNVKDGVEGIPPWDVPMVFGTCGTVEARKLEYDCPPTKKPGEEGKQA